MKRLVLLAAALLTSACGTSTPPGAPSPSDWEVSATRPIDDVPRRTIGFLEQGVWISNEFSGGRVSDAWAEGDSLVMVHIVPENAPINNSAWYAFRIWADAPRTVQVRLTYENGRHRYWPKLLHAEDAWVPLDSSAVEVGPDGGWATLTLDVGPDTLTVAGQELLAQEFFMEWLDELSALPHVSRSRIGTSGRGRLLELFRFGSGEANRHVVLVSRQHPPEVTGTLALVPFVEEMLGDSPLAREFREYFQVHVVPLMNPDGVELGHWRHNTGGVDLNRDWVAFHQPETRAVRDEVTRIMETPGAELWFAADFHSTRRDVFYTLERSLETDPPGILDRWIQHLEDELPDYEVADGPSGLQTPMSRNWFYREFGSPGLIYEVGDDTDRDVIRRVAETAARGTMEILLDELRRQGG